MVTVICHVQFVQETYVPIFQDTCFTAGESIDVWFESSKIELSLVHRAYVGFVSLTAESGENSGLESDPFLVTWCWLPFPTEDCAPWSLAYNGSRDWSRNI